MGFLSLVLPALLVGNRGRENEERYDPEKAVRANHTRRKDELQSIQHDTHDNGNDYSGATKLNRRVRHTNSKPPRIPSTQSSRSSSNDIVKSVPNMSLYRRIKAYVWPSDEQSSDLDSIVPDYRWTPIISGVVIPFSILLEIPGLTEHWYIRTEGNKTVETKSNSPILVVALAVSIFCAWVANVGLILRFLEKRVQTVTLLCIVFLTIHDIINIVTVTTFGVEHRFDDGFTYGEAFWMTLCSTIASTVTNVSLIVDLIRTPDFAKRGSGLTRKQRALMIIVIILLVNIAIGSLINSLLLHLTFIDGLYFTVVSIETIGFGDIVAKSTGARVWTCFYVVIGVVNIGVAIAMCRETILEGLEIGYRRRLRDMRQRRRDARRYRRWEARWQRAVKFRLREAGMPIWVPDETPRPLPHDVSNGGKLFGRIPGMKRVGFTIKRTATMTSVDSVFGGRRNQHLNVEALTMAQLEEAALEAGVPLDMFLDTSDRRREHKPKQHGHDHEDAREVHGIPIPEQSRGNIAPALAQTQAAHAFVDTISTGWPSDPQTPTHAQLGRMAAMLTKFAVAVSGAHAYARGAPSEAPSDRPPPGSRSGSESGGLDRSRNGSPADIRDHPAAKWLKDFSRGANQRSQWTYEKFRLDMDAEEKKAYYVKLTIAWVLFFCFWTVGSGIFSATEGWPYGVAMYFCFLAFTTTGYGDFSPKTPAGRSVFVVWALFGVGTLTILVSVLQEAGSSRYKSALHSHVFDKAVNKYQRKQVQEGKQRPRPTLHKQSSGSDPIEHSVGSSHGSASGRRQTSETHWRESQTRPTFERLEESKEIAQKALEALPSEIVRMARTFHDYMQFFVAGGADGMIDMVDDEDEEGGSGSGTGKSQIPPDMRKLLEELAQMEGINERVKAEILQDEDARKTLFMLSLERSLKRLVKSAEKALSALADRDALASISTVQQAQPGQGGFNGDHDSTITPVRSIFQSQSKQADDALSP